MSKSSPVAICAEQPTQIFGPAHEYIRLMRSYLSETQKVFVRDQIEALARDAKATTKAYADLVRSLLTPEQTRETTYLLGALYVDRGWFVSAARPSNARASR